MLCIKSVYQLTKFLRGVNMSEESLETYDMSIIADAVKIAKKTKNVYLEDLIEGFISEKEDQQYKNTLYKAIVESRDFLKHLL